MKGIFPIEKFKNLQTPFYYYNTDLLRHTLDTAKKAVSKYGYCLHYAVKANANPRILSIVKEYGLGADCVGGGEIQAVLKEGFPANKIVYAGVGKADWEIELGLDNDIFCFNTESLPELEVIDELARERAKVANVALRINPEVNAHTHHHITTGLKENKFGINLEQLDKVIESLSRLKNIKLIGLHFHIGSQIRDLEPFRALCKRANELQDLFVKKNIILEHINFGGGLGIDYECPDSQAIPDFESYFRIFHEGFKALPGQQIHFELGRSLVGQSGSLISKVLYVKEGTNKKFVILDAGFTDLLRPAFYGAYHKIENLSSEESKETYDVVGPICESSDSFAKEIEINKTGRGDYITLRSAGAYGETMASQYNCRRLPMSYFSDLI